MLMEYPFVIMWARSKLLITLLLFIAALFVKGFTHDLLLEAGVFLVSVKVIMMAYKISVIIREIREIKAAIRTN